MDQYLKTLTIMNRELSRLPKVSEYAEEALLAANSALGESEIVAHKVLELSLRIKNELRVKVIEMQSFSPEELAHIPRKCEYFKRLLIEVMPTYDRVSNIPTNENVFTIQFKETNID